jgi:rSAM-associated Gly-rich repeat protein
MKRSLIAFQALLASSAVLCQSAEATSIFNAPDQTNNTVEARIEAARNGNWESLLKNAEPDEALVAKGKWKNGNGNKWSNGGKSSGKWGNGKGGGKFGNSRNSWGNGGYRVGWGNGGGGWRNGGGGFANW